MLGRAVHKIIVKSMRDKALRKKSRYLFKVFCRFRSSLQLVRLVFFLFFGVFDGKLNLRFNKLGFSPGDYKSHKALVINLSFGSEYYEGAYAPS